MNLFGDLAGKMLGGQQAGGGINTGAILEMLGGQTGGLGGIAGLAQLFQNKGLGDLVSSWVGTGANLPVSANQIQDVLGSDQLGALASKFGLSPDQAGSQLADLLPGVIDQLTPNGQVPDSGNLMELGQSLLGGLFNR